jgi:hypothetical protein
MPNAAPDQVGLWDPLSDEPGLYATAMIETAERAIQHRKMELAQQSLDQAAAILRGAEIHPSLMQRLQAVQLKMDEWSPASGSSPAGGNLSRESAAPGSRPRYLIEIIDRRISITGPGQERRLISTHENAALQILVESTHYRTPHRLIRHILQDTGVAIDELREPFRNQPGPLPPEGSTLILFLTEPRLVATPWELAIPAESSPIRVGSGQTEGTLPYDRSGAEEFAQVKRPFSERTSIAFGLPLLDKNNADNTIPDLLKELAFRHVHWDESDAMDIVYLNDTVEDSLRQPEPVITGGITADLVGRSIGKAAFGHRRPFVIMEVLRPSSIPETLEQLMARNQFAQNLINTGAVSGVFATGLALQNQVSDMRRATFKALLEADTVIDVLASFRRCFFLNRTSSGNFEEAIGPLGSALFLPAAARDFL